MVVVTLEIDGHIQLPESVRERLGLHPGARLALEQADDNQTLQLRVLRDSVELVEKDGVWVIRREGAVHGENQEDPVAQSRQERLASLSGN